MRHWLLKTEPSTFGVENLERAPRRTVSWDGVRNFQARNLLRDEVKRGDQAFLYYSSCEVPGIAAIVTVTREGYPDATAFDRNDEHFDPDSKRDAPRWYAVDVKLDRVLSRIITLQELRARAGKELRGMVLLRPGNRLSVSPVEAAHWKFILSLE